MESRENLEKRVKDLERQLGQQRLGVRGIRKRANFECLGLPFYDIAVGPDLARGEMRGHAKGVIAIGDMATGIIALGGLARGVVAFGGLAIGGIAFGGLSIGALVAVGGLAIGSVAFGGGAAGGVAMGGGAAGYYACGGAAIGEYVVRPNRSDPQAHAFFSEYGLDVPCGGSRSYPIR